MKRHFLATTLLILMILPAVALQAQKLTLRLKNGNENTELLDNIQKLHFSQGQLLVDFKSGMEDAYSLADVQKIYFEGSVSVVENLNAFSDKLMIYPNPAGDIITVTGFPEGTSRLSLYRMDGGLAISREITSSRETIEIGSLSSGLYFIHAAGFTTKFIKK